MLTGQHLVHHDAQRKQICLSGDVLFLHLLGRHVAWRAYESHRHRLRRTRAINMRDTEIRDFKSMSSDLSMLDG